jgi:hypothetical protein
MVQKGHSLVEITRWSVETGETAETETDGRDLGAISAQESQMKRHFEVRKTLREEAEGKAEGLCWSRRHLDQG